MGFMGSMVQAHSISDAFHNAFNIPPYITGLVVATLSLIIFMGGVKRIAFVTEKMVPIMAIVYITMDLVVVLINYSRIPDVFIMIFKGAFNPSAVWGGALGFGLGRTVRYGIARGLFSNEAGLGSIPHAHAVAQVKHPVEQGVFGITAVFLVTFIVLTITVITVLSADVIHFEGSEPSLKGIQLVQEAFSKHLFGKTFGYSFTAICLSLHFLQ